MEYDIQLPSKPLIVEEDETHGVYQIDNLYPGYGHTLGNSLRRIILSSLPGAAVTAINIDGVSHEFSTIDGVQEDVINIALNLKQIRLKMNTDEPQIMRLKVTGPKEVTAADIETPGQVEIVNPDVVIMHITGKETLNIELHVQKGLGYVPKELLYQDKIDVGTIALDAIFSPIRRVNYEVENMRVGDRTDFNRLKILIETDGTIDPHTVLEEAIRTMIYQLKAVVGFREEEEIEEEPIEEEIEEPIEEEVGEGEEGEEDEAEFLKTRIESLDFSTRTENALINANIRTVGGLVRKKEEDILNIEGLGEKGLQEIKRMLGNRGILLK